MSNIREHVKALTTGTEKQKEQAAAALRSLSVNADNKIAVAKAGAIDPLVALVRSGTDGQKEQAAAALWSLSVNADNKIAIAKAGAIDPLVALVRSGTDEQKEQAAGALRCLGVPEQDWQVNQAKAQQPQGHVPAQGALNAPGKWRFFISYTQRSKAAEVLALELFTGLKDRGETVWLDKKMSQCDTAAMKEGVLCSDCFLCIISGSHVQNNRYFERQACVAELTWAIQHSKTVVPVVDAEDKKLVGEFIAEGKAKGFDLSGSNFIDIIRSNPIYTRASLECIADAAQKQSKAKFVQGVSPTSAPAGGMGLLDKVRLIKTSLGIEVSAPASVISEANAQLGLQSNGPLPAQAEAVMAALGI